MARKVRDADLDTRNARMKLKARGKPHYRRLDPGLHIGYRKPRSGAGRWVIRVYAGDGEYRVESIATADDLSDANGVDVLSFAQAQTRARALRDNRSRAGAGITGPLTVADAMASYLDFLENNRRSARDAASRIKLYIKPKLGHIEIGALTADRLRAWHRDLAKTLRAVRTAEGAKTKHLPIRPGVDGIRARKASANRTLTTLKAALNRLWRDGKVASDQAWRAVEPFEAVESARVRYLDLAECRRLVNACDADFRKMVQAALQTGARYGELCALQVHDFNADAGTIAVRRSKSGKPRHVVLTDEGRAYFKQVVAGRSGSAPMFVKPSGEAWSGSDQKRPMAAACERGKIIPRATFHTLRHTWASLSVMAGVPLLVVAKNLGHSDTRMVEKHYGHLAPSYIADAIRANAPRFGFKPDRRVVTLAGRAAR